MGAQKIIIDTDPPIALARQPQSTSVLTPTTVALRAVIKLPRK